MNIFLWIVQVLLALHTAIGAGWKLFNPETSVPSLAAIPHGVWVGLIGFDLICAVGLVIPAFVSSLGYLVPLAAVGIAVEMLGFSVVHLRSGAAPDGQILYWLVLAAVCAVVAIGRFTISPL